MSIFDTAVHVGEESAYGSAETTTVRSYEARSDSFKWSPTVLDAGGFYKGAVSPRADRRVVHDTGGEGSLELVMMNKGMGKLLQGLLGGAAGPTQQGATTAYLQTYTMTAAGPSKSFTVQWNRPTYTAGEADEVFTHIGACPIAWHIKQEASGLLVAELDFVYQQLDYATAEATAAYISSPTPFDWTHASVSVGGASVGYVNSLDLDVDLGMRTDRFYLDGTGYRSQPKRSTHPSITGTLDADFETDDHFHDWYSATVLSNLVLTWTGANIEDTYDYEFKLTIPSFMWEGDTPETSTDDHPKQPLKFRAFYNGSDPMITMTYQSTDTAV